jgi:hypothetical protein
MMAVVPFGSALAGETVVADTQDARELKRTVGAHLLEIAGVSGVGVRGGRLTVYLERDDPAVRRQAEEVVGRLSPGASVAFKITGRFRAL